MPRRAARRVVAAMAALGALAAFAWPRLEKQANGEEPVTDKVAPRGMIAFFAGGACPPGWVPAEEVEGRLVVAVTEPSAVSVKVGAPLADREDRTHTHAVSGKVTLSSKDVVAFDGSNKDGAAAGVYSVAGTASAETTGLPFVQVRACARP